WAAAIRRRRPWQRRNRRVNAKPQSIRESLMDATVAPPAQGLMQRRRTRWLFIVSAAFVVLAIAGIAYWWLYARNYEETDDAYVAGDLVNVTSQVNGTV